MKDLAAELGEDLAELAWLVKKARTLSAAAKKQKRRREAHAILSFDERGRLSIRLRPEETPDTDRPDDPQGA